MTMSMLMMMLLLILKYPYIALVLIVGYLAVDIACTRDEKCHPYPDK